MATTIPAELLDVTAAIAFDRFGAAWLLTLDHYNPDKLAADDIERDKYLAHWGYPVSVAIVDANAVCREIGVA